MKSCGPQWPHLTHSGWNYPIQYNEQHSNKQTNKQTKNVIQKLPYEQQASLWIFSHRLVSSFEDMIESTTGFFFYTNYYHSDLKHCCGIF